MCISPLRIQVINTETTYSPRIPKIFPLYCLPDERQEAPIGDIGSELQLDVEQFPAIDRETAEQRISDGRQLDPSEVSSRGQGGC